MESQGSVTPEYGTTLRTNDPRPQGGKPLTSHQHALFEQYHAVVHLEATAVHRRVPPWIELDALIQSGMVGLLDALTRYEASREATFSRYVRYRIKGEIIEHLRSLDWVSRSVRSWERKMATAGHRCRERLGRDASAEEVATELGISLEHYYQLTQHLHAALLLRLEPPASSSEEESDMEYEVVSPGPDPATEAEQRNIEARVTAACATLSEREQRILQLYYHEELTLKEIGERLHVTEARVCQIHAQAILRLREILAEERNQNAALN
jgi:RNA polymerase sigma factor for flagellar operon FliA